MLLNSKGCEFMGSMIDNEQEILIDKMIVSNLEIKDILDCHMLLKKGIIQNSESPVQYRTQTGKTFTHLCISNQGMINKFTAGAIARKNFKQEFCILELCIPDNNLIGFNFEEYIKMIYQIKEQLLNQFGIIVSEINAKIKYIEIQRTFSVEYDFSEYERPIKFIFQNLPKTFKLYMNGENRDQNETPELGSYYASTKTGSSDRFRTIKIYNKSADMKKRKGLDIDKNYMRVEMILSNTTVIESAFGTNKIFQLTQEIIEQYYNKQIKKMIVKKYEKWEKERQKIIKRIIDDIKVKFKSQWISHFLRYLQDEEIRTGRITILDIHDIFPVISKFKINRQGKYKIRKALEHHATTDETAYIKRDDLKLNEILSKMLPDYWLH